MSSTTSSTSSSSGSVLGADGLQHYFGLASGLDIDSIVKGLMTGDQNKLDKAGQQKQILQWKQTAYQDIYTALKTFKSSYFDILNKSTCLLSSNTFKEFDAASTNTAITASANADATAGTHTIKVTQSEVTASVTGTHLSSAITGSVDARTASLAGKSFYITADGVQKQISFSSSDTFTDAASLQTLLNNKLSDAFGKDSNDNCKVAATVDGTTGQVSFNANGGYQTIVSVSSPTENDALVGLLGNNMSGASNRISIGGILNNHTPVYGTNSALNKDLSGYSFNIDLTNINKDGSRSFRTVTVNLPSKSYGDSSEMQKDLQAALDTTTGVAGTVKASVSSKGQVSFDTSSSVIAKFSDNGTSQGLEQLGFTSANITNGLQTWTESGKSLKELYIDNGANKITGYGADGQFKVNINGTDVTLNIYDNLTQTFNKINNSAAGVTVSYNNISDIVKITSTQGGAAGKADLSGDTSGFMGCVLGADAGRTTVKGRDAIATVDGVSVTRDSNHFTVGGVTYNINKDIASTDAAETSTVNLTAKTDDAVSAVKKFVSDYNSLIDKINAQTTVSPEKDGKGFNTSYPPLTDAQKEKMTDDEIKNYEVKAKQGLLFNDSTLMNITDSLREMVDTPVTTSSGKSMLLSDIGISVSSDWTDGGKLELDEDKFKTALLNQPDDVTQMFTKTSAISYNRGSSDQQTRIDEEGFANRFKDIIDNAITSSGGTKGALVQVAGLPNDSTQTDSDLYKQLVDINTKISDLKDQYTTDIKKYYNQFTKLETYIQQMNSQSSYISQLGGSN